MFEPTEWAKVFKRSGAKYVVLTSKHHDGYCLWPSNEASESFGIPWNSVDSGPSRDLVGDLTDAVREEGIKMGLYYSIWDWFNPYWPEEDQPTRRKKPCNDVPAQNIFMR
jgi:alpha-L-fucosidase